MARGRISHWLENVRPMMVFLVPAVLSPLLFISTENEQAIKCAYVFAIIAIFGVFEVIPIEITSLIPLILIPLFGILSSTQVAREYCSDTHIMVLSSLIIAIAIEQSNLSHRIILKMILALGTSPRRLLLGVMLPTMLMSMFLPNIATTSLMVQLVKSLLQELDEHQQTREITSGILQTIPTSESISPMLPNYQNRHRRELRRNVGTMLYLSVAYTANTSGTGTLVGHPLNLLHKSIIDRLTGAGKESPLTFANYMAFATPPMLANILCLWVFLQLWFLGMPGSFCRRSTQGSKKHTQQEDKDIRYILEQRLLSLGKITFRELSVLFLFIFMTTLWMTRDDWLLPGWGNQFVTEYNDIVLRNESCTVNCLYDVVKRTKNSFGLSTVGILVVVAMFIWPSNLSFWNSKKDGNIPAPTPRLLQLDAVMKNVPWGVLWILGGARTMARAAATSGLVRLLAEELASLAVCPPVLLVTLACVAISLSTELANNMTIASMFLPVLANLAITSKVNPLYFTLPATLTTANAFMLPFATIPNAIVYTASGIRISDMVKCGIMANIICLGLNLGFLHTLGTWIFNLDNYPTWL